MSESHLEHRKIPSVVAARIILSAMDGAIETFVTFCAVVISATFTRSSGVLFLRVIADPFLALKRRAYAKFNIVFCRPFDLRLSQLSRSEIVPVLGAFGRVLHISNDGYEGNRTSRIPLNSEPTSLGSIITADEVGDWIDAQPSTFDTFKLRMTDYARVADVAVVDVTRISRHLWWELEMCLQEVDPRRILLIANELTDDAGSAKARLVEHARGTVSASDMPFIYGSTRTTRQHFRRRIFAWMKGLSG